MKRKQTAFTLAEILVVLGIIAVVTVLGTIVIAKSSPEVYKLRTKQSYLLLKRALGAVVTNPLYYTPEGNLADLSASTTDDETYVGTTKFRELMLKEMEIDDSSRVDCEILTSSGPEVVRTCYQTENSVIFGIPNTDFINENLIRHRNVQGSVANYLPITIYPNSSIVLNQKSGYLEKGAIFIGVRADGAVSIVNSIDCEEGNNKDTIQCRAADYISTLSIDFE